MSAPPFLNLTGYATRLAEIVPDNRQPYTRTDLVEEALRLYAQDYPATETADVGDGTLFEWDLSASPFEAWSSGFSDLWPVEVEELSGGLTQRPRVELTQGQDYYVERRSVAGVLKTYLVFVSAPTSVRVRFSRPWIVTDAAAGPPAVVDANEVPIHHQEAVAKLAGSYACELLAAHYLKTVDAALGSDAFSAMDVVDRYQQKAAALKRAYKDALGVGEETSASLGRCNTRIPRTFGSPYLGNDDLP